jgi:hypothetical protein
MRPHVRLQVGGVRVLFVAHVAEMRLLVSTHLLLLPLRPSPLP